MSTTQDRPSGIPKASRLPRPTVTIPKLPSPSSSVSSIRPTTSRESLSGGIATARDLYSPSRSPVSSRTSIQSVPSSTDSRSYVRHCASKDQLRPGGPKTHSCSRHAAPPPPPKNQKNSSSSRRWSTVTHNPTLQFKPWAEPRQGDPERDDYGRAPSQAEDNMPESLLASYLNGTLGNAGMTDGEPLSSIEDCMLPDLSVLKMKRAGSSLTERTVETLSQLPSSPAGSRKSSAFYGDSRRCSLADVTASSRPGSSYNSELSSGLASPIATKAPPPSSRHGMPSSRYSMSHVPDARFPLPVKRLCGAVHGRTCSKPAPEKKLVKPKPLRSARNQSISALTTASGSDPSGAWDGSIQPLAPNGVKGAEEPGFGKSSTSLRDHIARAKAAKRAAMKLAGGDEISSVGYDTAGMSPATGFDESVHDDPFNLKRGGNKILKQRVGDARTSGRLNIAALGLKEVPAEVMKMYDFESIQESGGTWSDSVDLKRFIAADNELEKLDDTMFPDHDPATFEDSADDQKAAGIFGGLESMDLHGNQIMSVPVGLRRLAHLTSLNLSSNRLDNDCLSVITQISSLRDLKLAKNCLAGPLDACLANLTLLETLDIHDNHVSALPSEIANLKRLRILSLSENNFESIDFESLAKLPLTELDLKRNKLSGTLIEDSMDSLPNLQTFDISSNRLTRLVPEGASIKFPVLHTLLLSMNRLQELPDVSSWTNLLTLTADTNNIGAIPRGFASLARLRQADFSSNDIKVVPPEVARMEDLTMLRLSGNPLREKKFAAASADAIKAILASRLESVREVTDVEELPVHANKEEKVVVDEKSDEGEESDDDENFSTPPTSALPSPSEAKDFSSLEPDLQVRTGGTLDNSRTESATLDQDLCARLAAQHPVYNAQLHHNLYICIPGALSAFAETLTSLALGHNQMIGESYLVEELKLPSLSELNLTSNHITSLGPLTKFLRAPSLEKIDISMNRLSTLPLDLKQNFPKMMVLLASNNRLVDLDPASIRGLQVVDVSSNEIAHLDPRIGLLGGRSGLQKLELMGNRFRAPRWNVLESGTEATMRWLRGRVSAADRAAWKAEHGDDSVEDEDELD